jgi:hypothetical protein
LLSNGSTCTATTGQRKAIEDPDSEETECPFVAIWDVRTCEEVARVNLDPSARAAVAAAFSPDGGGAALQVECSWPIA